MRSTSDTTMIGHSAKLKLLSLEGCNYACNKTYSMAVSGQVSVSKAVYLR